MNQSAPLAQTVSAGKPVTSGPLASQDAAASVLELLRIEGDARSVSTTQELAILIANETRKVTRARQVFVFVRQANNAMSIQAATGLPVVDRTVPLMQCLENAVSRLRNDVGLEQTRDFVLATYTHIDDETAKSYPMQQIMWLPLKYRTGSTIAGFLLARDEPWTTNDHAIAERLRLTFSQAWYWLATSKRASSVLSITPKRGLVATALLLGTGFIPVSMTTLAPLALAPSQQMIITAPLDGVIQAIPVQSNDTVAAGQLLVQFNDTSLRSHFAVAEREMEVADARVKKAMLLALTEANARHELAIAKAELNVKIADRNYARDMLARATIMSEVGGIAIFGDKRDIVGKPVIVGEKIMEIANPDQVEIHIDVPVTDAIILAPGARVKAYLDSDPLTPLEANVVRADYQAKNQEGGTLAFRVVAGFRSKVENMPRLGTRGTAQLFGKKVPLFYFIFRRPISSLRQWTGL